MLRYDFRIKTMFGSSLSQLFVGNPNNPVIILRFARVAIADWGH
jgi:hypothetical protein